MSRRWDRNANPGVDDMVLLGKLKNSAVVDNLKKRHAAHVIYTFIGNVCIVVNPYKFYPLYGPDQIKRYHGAFPYENSPHVYAIAERAYTRMRNEDEAQCVIISGESGAGKTEAAKQIMQFVAAVTGSSRGVEEVKKVILETNPLLEAFGNAKTVRNDNSSRFGKYFEILFDENCDPCGGRIRNFLLEKSRVCFQGQGERNFHVFYQLMDGASQQERNDLQLMNPQDFYFTACGGCYTVENKSDAEEWGWTRSAMTSIGISAGDQTSILELLAAVLYLGNVTFQEGPGGTQPADISYLQVASRLLKVQPNALIQSIIVKTMLIGREALDVVLEPELAAASRDALCKALYDRTFDYLVRRINECLNVAGWSGSQLIGILDIYGFEIFDNNGFEQLCINYINEKLQQIFINLTLKGEQAEYEREGIQWTPIKFFDNKIVCDLIDGRPGIMTLLDDTCQTSMKMESFKADLNFVDMMRKALNHPHLHIRMNDFEVVHYAGNVNYNIQGFTDTNKDLLNVGIIECMQRSGTRYIQALFPEDVAAMARKRPTTFGFKIVRNARELIDTLGECNPHYVRCIKPNETKSPKDFNYERVMHQAKYLGLLENIRVRRAGFAYRREFLKFYHQFRLLSPRCFPKLYSGPDKDACVAILEDLEIDRAEWQIGRTKVFLRHPETLFHIEDLKERKFQNASTTISRAWRKYKLKRYFYDLKQKAADLLENKKQRRRVSINRQFQGDYIDYLNNAQLQEVVGEYKAAEGGIVFSDVSYRPIRKFIGHRIQKQYLLVTTKAAYFIERKLVNKKPPVYQMMIEMRIPISQIACVSMSLMADNFVIIKTQDRRLRDMFFQCENKVELLSVLNDQYKEVHFKDVPREFANSIQYQVTDKGKRKKINFRVAEANSVEVLKATLLAWNCKVKTGMPASSRPATENITQSKMGRSAPAPVRQRSGKKIHRPAAAAAQAAPSAFAGRSRGGGGGFRGGGGGFRGGGGGGRGGGGGGRPNFAMSGGFEDETRQQSFRVPTSAATGRQSVRAGADRKRCLVLYDYEAVVEDELTIHVGDTVTLITKDASGWWLGELNGRKGLFPGNYVEEQ